MSQSDAGWRGLRLKAVMMASTVGEGMRRVIPQSNIGNQTSNITRGTAIIANVCS